MSSTPHSSDPKLADPVRARRAVIARWNALATRIGYAAFGISIVAVMVGAFTDFSALVARVATGGLIVGSILLAPAIVIGYAIKAAEKEDRQLGV
jgi:hypothetical protein